MVPPVTHPIWRQLVTGERSHAFHSLSAAMCTARIIRFVHREGGREDAIALGVGDLHAFFCKCEPTLAEDLQALFPEVFHADQP